MKIKRKNQKKTSIVILVCLISLVIVGSSLYFIVFKKDDATNKTTSTSENIPKYNQGQSNDIHDSTNTKNQAPNSDHPATPDTNSGSTKKKVQMVASTDRLDSVIFIRGGINYPATGGSCYVQLSGPAGESVRKDSTTLQNPASTDCHTISIPVSELSPGEWSFILYYNSDQYEGESDEVSFIL